MFEKRDTFIPGCFEIIHRKLEDNRGFFAKSFHVEMFNQLRIEFICREEFFSTSNRSVFRGMHFQLPPRDVDKIVSCIDGHVTDYVVDLRKNSPSFGKWLAFELKGDRPTSLFIPRGLAHGFYVRSETAVMHYKCTEVYDPALDAGISYESFGFAPEIKSPVVSEKDLNLPTLDSFNNPFVFIEK